MSTAGFVRVGRPSYLNSTRVSSVNCAYTPTVLSSYTSVTLFLTSPEAIFKHKEQLACVDVTEGKCAFLGTPSRLCAYQTWPVLRGR